MTLSAAGAIVSSIAAYSETAPVLHVWNRWFSPGSCLVVTRVLPPFLIALAISSRFSLGGTCRSFSPFNASTGHCTLASVGRGSKVRKKRNQGDSTFLTLFFDQRLDLAGLLALLG